MRITMNAKTWIITGAATLTAAAGITTGLLLTAPAHPAATPTASPAVSTAPASPVNAVSTPLQPPTVAQVAGLIGAVRSVSCGPAPVGGVTDSGTAYIGDERIGIDIFPTATVRDNWLSTAANFGITPMKTGTTWVSYKATDQTAKGCS